MSVEIAYRQMLAKLSNMIKRDELESMKFLSIDIIPRGLLDDIESCIQLWVALEERDALSSDNTQFLETLLTSACGNRQDVVAVLDAYKGTILAGTVKEDLYKEFDLIVANLGRDWRPLARKLGLQEGDIDAIAEKHERNLQEQIRQSLVVWQRTQKDLATKQQLISALRACQKNMLVHQLQNAG